MIAIVDYGMGNLRSVQKALQRVGADARIVQAPEEVLRSDKVVLPGVGAFQDAIARLRDLGLADALIETAASGKGFLGICLGLQLLFDVSHEDGRHEGLGILPGEVVRFDFGPDARGRGLSIPHMGWNQIQWERPDPVLAGIAPGAYTYFAHSYHVVPAQKEIIATTTTYGYDFASSVRRDNVFATQFHPEKSQALGLAMLRNFVQS